MAEKKSKKKNKKADQVVFQEPTPITQDMVEEPAERVADSRDVKSVIDGGIDHVVSQTGVEGQKNRFKAMRAIAYQAFSELVEEGTYEDVIERALDNAENLPHGWKLFPEMKRAEEISTYADVEPAKEPTEDVDLDGEPEAEPVERKTRRPESRRVNRKVNRRR